MNGIIIKSFNGTQYVPQQICRKLLLVQFSLTLANGSNCFVDKAKMLEHFESLTRAYRIIFNVQKHGNVIAVGTGSPALISIEESFVERMGIPTNAVVKYKKVMGMTRRRMPLNKSARINSVVCFKDGTFGVIECILGVCRNCASQ